jgi:DNA-binding transcriptional regulator YhcF (GntR family)
MKQNKNKLAYQAAYDKILDLLRSGEYLEGEVLPARAKLSKILGVGAISIQQAEKELADEGYLENLRGSGCYVRKRPAPLNKPSIATEKKFDYSFDDFLGVPGRGRRQKEIKIAMAPSEIRYFPDHWQKIFDDYMILHPEIKIVSSPLENINHMFEELEEPGADIFQLPLSFVQSLAKKEKLFFNPADIGGLKHSEDDYFQNLIEPLKIDGQLYGYPLMASGDCLYYNKKYEEFVKGIFPVVDFWDFLEKCRELSTKLPKEIDALISNNHTLFELIPMGIRTKIKDYKDLIDFNLPEYRDFILKFEPYYHDSKLFYPECDVAGLDALRLFFSEKVIFMFGNSCWLPSFKNMNILWGVMPEPLELPENVMQNGLGEVISKYTPYPQECADFMEYLGSFEVQKPFAEEGRLIAHKKASEYFSFPGLDEVSTANLLKTSREGTIFSANGKFIGNYNESIMNHEMHDWQHRKLSGEDFVNQLSTKTKLFFRSKNLQEHLKRKRMENLSQWQEEIINI